MPNGLILQWGVDTTSRVNGTFSLAFNTAFTAAAYVITATPIMTASSSNQKITRFDDGTGSQVTMNIIQDDTGGYPAWQGFNWIAIGPG